MEITAEFRKKMIVLLIEALKESPSFRNFQFSQLKEAVLKSEHQTFQQSKSKEEYVFYISEKLKKIKNAAVQKFEFRSDKSTRGVYPDDPVDRRVSQQYSGAVGRYPMPPPNMYQAPGPSPYPEGMYLRRAYDPAAFSERRFPGQEFGDSNPKNSEMKETDFRGGEFKRGVARQDPKMGYSGEQQAPYASPYQAGPFQGQYQYYAPETGRQPNQGGYFMSVESSPNVRFSSAPSGEFTPPERCDQGAGYFRSPFPPSPAGSPYSYTQPFGGTPGSPQSQQYPRVYPQSYNYPAPPGTPRSYAAPGRVRQSPGQESKAEPQGAKNSTEEELFSTLSRDFFSARRPSGKSSQEKTGKMSSERDESRERMEKPGKICVEEVKGEPAVDYLDFLYARKAEEGGREAGVPEALVTFMQKRGLVLKDVAGDAEWEDKLEFAYTFVHQLYLTHREALKDSSRVVNKELLETHELLTKQREFRKYPFLNSKDLDYCRKLRISDDDYAVHIDKAVSAFAEKHKG